MYLYMSLYKRSTQQWNKEISLNEIQTKILPILNKCAK